MNQYRCETCKNYEDDDGKSACNIREEWISTDVWNWIKVVGCASHSDFQSERDKIICCARCPCKEPDCEDFCKHFQPTGDLIAVIKDGDLIESREALEHHFGRHDTCKSERTRCPLCREELRQAGEP